MEIKFLTAEEVILINKRMIEIAGGIIGIRDETLLLSALANPENLFYYENADIYMIASQYAFSIIKNHAFLDGNKRTGFQAMNTFLRKNGIYLNFPSTPITDDKMVDIANNKITVKELALWLSNLAKS